MTTKPTRILVALAISAAAAACSPHARAAIPTEVRGEVASRYLRGESLATVAADLLHGDRDQARAVIHDAILAMSTRYYRER